MALRRRVRSTLPSPGTAGVRVAAAVLLGCTVRAGADPPAAPAAPTPLASAPCLPDGGGYLRARMRGARSLDLNWHNAELQCQGEAREDAPGIRLSFAGPLPGGEHRLRLVFGVRSLHEAGSAEHALPTNLTVIFEGDRRLYATQGDDRCTIDELHEERLLQARAPGRTYRVVARGFCVAPANALVGAERILVERFDFAGRVVYGAPRPRSP